MQSTLAASLASDTLVAPHHHSTACLNCGQEVPGRFCSHCGQDAHHTHRITMAHMLHDIPHSIWHVDKGILFTLKNMLLRPGPTILGYLAGKRVDHFRPLSLLLLVTSLYALLSSLLHIQPVPPEDPTVPEAVRQMQELTVNFMSKYLSWMFVGMIPIGAVFARLLLRRGGFNYAECLIAVAFVTAISNFFALLYLPVTYAYSDTHQVPTSSFVLLAGATAYATWAYGSLLVSTKLSLLGRLWRGFLTYVLGYSASIIMLVVLIYALNWSTFKRALIQQQKQLRTEQARQTTTPAASKQP